MVGGRMVVAGCPGATGLGDPTVGNGWKKKLLAGFVGPAGLTGVVGGRGVVTGTGAGLVGVGGLAGVVGLGVGLGTGLGDGDAGLCTDAGSGKLKGENAVGLPVGAGLRVVAAKAAVGVGRGAAAVGWVGCGRLAPGCAESLIVISAAPGIACLNSVLKVPEAGSNTSSDEKFGPTA